MKEREPSRGLNRILIIQCTSLAGLPSAQRDLCGGLVVIIPFLLLSIYKYAVYAN